MHVSASVISLVCLSILTLSTESAAQGRYVTVSGLFDSIPAARLLGIEHPSGATFGGALRVGVPIGPAWGVELEIGRGGHIRELSSADPLREPAQAAGLAIVPGSSFIADVQVTSLTTSIWWRRRLNGRFDLRYLGGAAVTRKRTGADIALSNPEPVHSLTGLQVLQLEEVDYSIGVGGGLETGIKLTERLLVVSGIRLVAVPSTWVVRTTAGLEWTF